jgi:hypothetical protein
MIYGDEQHRGASSAHGYGSGEYHPQINATGEGFASLQGVGDRGHPKMNVFSQQFGRGKVTTHSSGAPSVDEIYGTVRPPQGPPMGQPQPPAAGAGGPPMPSWAQGLSDIDARKRSFNQGAEGYRYRMGDKYKSPWGPTKTARVRRENNQQDYSQAPEDPGEAYERGMKELGRR